MRFFSDKIIRFQLYNFTGSKHVLYGFRLIFQENNQKDLCFFCVCKMESEVVFYLLSETIEINYSNGKKEITSDFLLNKISRHFTRFKFLFVFHRCTIMQSESAACLRCCKARTGANKVHCRCKSTRC